MPLPSWIELGQGQEKCNIFLVEKMIESSSIKLSLMIPYASMHIGTINVSEHWLSRSSLTY